ncbi:hypothetical protein [Haloferax sp. Q22]|uniref:hypothetical protein n=1 Tax=Haloferax sp. (strain Q22) TaxID=1526048 RepID=UPI000737D30A|nr:hypothetical protein [Haloferax sp. Q22]
MSEEMVKKSVDITQDDQDWLEESPINFSKFCRRKLAERRAEEINKNTKKRLYDQIQQMVEKGSELRKQHTQKQEELEEKYNCEVKERKAEYWIFEHKGSEYYGHWMPGQVFEDTGTEDIPEEAEEFGNKLVEDWYDKVDAFGDFVGNETDFTGAGGDELGQNLQGQHFLSDFTLLLPYVPTDISSISVKFLGRVVFDAEDFHEDEIFDEEGDIE